MAAIAKTTELNDALQIWGLAIEIFENELYCQEVKAKEVLYAPRCNGVGNRLPDNRIEDKGNSSEGNVTVHHDLGDSILSDTGCSPYLTGNHECMSEQDEEVRIATVMNEYQQLQVKEVTC